MGDLMPAIGPWANWTTRFDFGEIIRTCWTLRLERRLKIRSDNPSPTTDFSA
jgi:hypothetical protein